MSSHAITIGNADDGKAVHIDAKALVTTKMLVTANSGGGKSYVLRKVFEQVGATAQLIVLDMEGEFVTLREKLDMVIAGPGGEIPADVRSAGLLVRRLMERELSAVIDMSEMRHQDRRRFVRLFAETLVELPKSLWRPLFLGLDEAHQFAPEKGQGEAESTQAVIDLCTLGRKRGYCSILATQRISTLNKTAAGECNNKFIGRMTLDVDLKRAAFELGVSSAEALKMLRPLKAGEFYGFGPALDRPGVTRLTVGSVETTHPKAGQGQKLTPPKPSSTITAVVAELQDLPKQAEAEIKDLAAATKTIADLRRELKSTSKPADETHLDRHAATARKPLEQLVSRLRAGLEIAMKVIASIEAKGFDKTAVTAEEIEKAMAAARDQIVKLVQQRMDLRATEFEKFKMEARKTLASLQKLLESDINVAVNVTHNDPFTVNAGAQARRAGTSTRKAVVKTDIPAEIAEWFRPAHQRLLNALAWLESMGQSTWDRSVAAAIAGVSPKSSSFGNDVSRLSAGGLISYPSSGLIELTDAGRAIAAAPDSPVGLTELHDAWRKCPALRPAHVRLIDALIEKHPDDLSREELAEAAGVSALSSSFGNDVSRISSLGLAKYPKSGRVAAGPLLFPEGLA